MPWISLLRFWSTDGGSTWDALCNKKLRSEVGCRWRANDGQAGSTASGLVPINALAFTGHFDPRWFPRKQHGARRRNIAFGVVQFRSIDPLASAQGLNNRNIQPRTTVATVILLAQTHFLSESVRRKFLWVPRLGAPTLNRQGDLTIVEPDSCVGAPAKPAPGAQFRGFAILQAAEKKWSGREDLNLRPPGPEILGIGQVYSY